MNDQDEGLLAARQAIVAQISNLLSNRPGPIVVALDGKSGTGKSTLAALVENELDIALIPLDDFFSAHIPDAEWDEFSVEEKLKNVFDWQRLRKQAIEPLLTGRRATWHAFDFEAGLRPDGTYGMEDEAKVREPGDVILVEGAYAAGPQLADVVVLAILVEVPDEVRRARLRAREEKDFLEKWHARWDAVENYYFSEVRPRASFDLVVSGGQGAGDCLRENVR